MEENNAYILGTDQEELRRLEIQHKVWQSEAKRGWKLADFKAGDNILDLGCGPGYCSMELASIVGKTGEVIGVDRSDGFIKYLEHIKDQKALPIKPILSTFDELSLEDESLDGIYCRWALAWVPNPKEILEKLKTYLRPGSKMVVQEYYYWTSHRTQPEKPNLKKAISAALKSFKESDSEIDVGKHLHQWLDELGMKIINARLMPKLATPNSGVWKWPRTFYESYFPRLIKMGYLTEQDMENAFSDLESLERLPYATLWAPLMIEVVAEK